jgi:hypothetical protein
VADKIAAVIGKPAPSVAVPRVAAEQSMPESGMAEWTAHTLVEFETCARPATRLDDFIARHAALFK